MKEKGFWSSIGSVAAAILASTCCWLPLLLLAAGAGTAAASFVGFIESFRPVIIAVAFALVGVAAYFTYIHRSPEKCCAPAGEPVRGSRLKKLNKYLLPFLAIFVTAFTLFPSQILSIFRPETETELRAQASEVIVTLGVPGMT